MATRRIPIRDLLLLRMSPVVKYLIVSDTVFSASSGLLGPIFAIFVADFIVGGTAAVAGVAAAIFLLTRSVMQIPTAALIDKICGDKDDFWFMATGALISSLIPLAYLFISTPIELYAVQFILGLVTAFTYPSYMALFTRYIDKGREATVWSIYFTLTDLAAAATAAIGGVIATTAGFEAVIYIVVVIGVTGTIFYIPIVPELDI